MNSPPGGFSIIIWKETDNVIINNTIRIHPLALLDYKHLEDAAVIRQIDEATAGYEHKHDYFVFWKMESF